jgi:protein gp37
MKRAGRPWQVTRSKDATFYAPLKWTEPRRIFVCEQSDFFHPGADEWRDDAYRVVRDVSRHTYLICTKRIERAQQHFQPWPNIWLGVTAENQEQYDHRALELLRLYHHVSWVSLEPLLGPINLGTWLLRFRPDGIGGDIEYSAVHWVVVGGESGPNRREMKIEWLEDIVAQCKAANVPVFVKQDNGPRPGMQGRIPDELWIKEFPE